MENEENIWQVDSFFDIPKNYTGVVVVKKETKYWFKNGKSHCENGPAIEDAYGHKEWWFDNKHHRLDGPAMIFSDGTKKWFINGIQFISEEFFNKEIKKLCEENLLKIENLSDRPKYFTGITETKSGTKSWYVNGKHHRLDGPAYEYHSGRKEWWVNGKPHRLDGPSSEGGTEKEEYYIDGTFLSKEDFYKKIKELNLPIPENKRELAKKKHLMDLVSFEKMIFLGNGKYTEEEVEKLNKQLKHALSLLSGIQQCSFASKEDKKYLQQDQFEIERLAKSIVTALGCKGILKE